MMRARLLLSLGLVSSQAVGEPAAGQMPLADATHAVDTTSGILIGRRSLWQPNVTQHLGIPYAKAPVEDLRFAPPEPFLSRDTLHTQYYGAACPSHFFQNSNKTVPPWPMGETIFSQLSQHGEPFSEDCLSLNIWARPGNAGDIEKKAVMIWVHGGGFFKGSSLWSAFRGAKLANDFDVVVVTLNYRLSIFGFPSADFLDDVNPGLLDMRLAVEWVRDNIEKFGGDPDRITLCGQSSGALMIHEYSLTYAEDPIAHAFILQSGFGPWDAVRESRSRGEATKSWYDVAELLGCGNAEVGAETLGCMRQKPWEDVMSAGLEIYFSPAVDDKTWHSDPIGLIEAGRFAGKPLLLGNTADEGAYMAYLGSPPEFVDYYALAPHCAARAVAESRIRHDVPTWQYVYAGNWPNQDLGVGGGVGAWHGSEIGMIFGTSENVSRRPYTPEQTHLGELMGKAWTDFAKDPHNGLRKLGWPTYQISDEEPSIIRLGGQDSSEVVFEHIRERTASCADIDLEALKAALTEETDDMTQDSLQDSAGKMLPQGKDAEGEVG